MSREDRLSSRNIYRGGVKSAIATSAVSKMDGGKFVRGKWGEGRIGERRKEADEREQRKGMTCFSRVVGLIEW